MVRVTRDAGPCAACEDPGDLRELGIILCRACRDLLVVACLRKIRREDTPAGGLTYPCEFCLGLHLSESGWDLDTVPPGYVLRRQQIHAALYYAGLIGPALNPNTD